MFFTPSCAAIQAKSPKPITCPGEKGETASNYTITSKRWIILFRDFCSLGHFQDFFPGSSESLMVSVWSVFTLFAARKFCFIHPISWFHCFHNAASPRWFRVKVYYKFLNPQLCFPSAVSPQKVLVKPVNLTASFEVRGGNLTAIFSWDLSTVLRHQQLTGYQVTWAEVIPTNRHNNNKLPHSLISQSQILPPVSDVTNCQCCVWFMFGYRLSVMPIGLQDCISNFKLTVQWKYFLKIAIVSWCFF